MAVYYMSFVDPDRPKGDRFVGACLVHADSFEQAMQTAWLRRCNPGGEVLGHVVNVSPPDEKWFYRILSRAELDELEREMGSLN